MVILSFPYLLFTRSPTRAVKLYENGYYYNYLNCYVGNYYFERMRGSKRVEVEIAGYYYRDGI